MSEGLFKGIFSGVVLALSMQVCIVESSSEDSDDDDFSDAPNTMRAWMKEGRDSLFDDGQLTSLQVGSGPSLGAAPASLWGVGSGATSDHFNLQKLGGHLPDVSSNAVLGSKEEALSRGAVSSPTVKVLDDYALKTSYSHIYRAITNSVGNYLTQPADLAKYLLTVLVLGGLNAFLEGQEESVEIEYKHKKEGAPGEKKQKMNNVKWFGRHLFSTSLIGLLPTVNSRENCFELLKVMWNLHLNKHFVDGRNTSDLYALSDTLYLNQNPKPLLNAISQIMREYGPSIMVRLGFIENKALAVFASQFPVTYSVVQLSQDAKHKRWWVKHYQSREISSGLTDDNIYNLEGSVRGRASRWPNLKVAVKAAIMQHVPLTVDVSPENVVDALFHAILRQRYALFEWSRPFLPGPWETLTDEEKHIEDLLKGSSSSRTVSDEKVDLILKALNEEAEYPEKAEIAAKAFFMILEAPLIIYPVSASLDRLSCKAKRFEIFKMLTEIPEKLQEASYTDLIYQDWVLIELASGKSVSSEASPWGIVDANDHINKHASQIGSRFGEYDKNKLIRNVGSLFVQQRRQNGDFSPVVSKLDQTQWEIALAEAANFLLPGLRIPSAK